MAQKTKTSTLLKAGIWYTISHFLIKGISYLTTPIFTRIMSPEVIGELSNISSWVAILSPFVTMNIAVSMSLARFDYEDNLDDYVSSNLVFGSLVTAFLYLIVALNIEFFSQLFSMHKYIIHILFIYLLVTPAMSFFGSLLNIKFEYKKSVFISQSTTIVSTLLAIVLTLVLDDQLFARVIASYVFSIVVNGCVYIYLLKKSHKISFDMYKYGFKKAFPMIWHTTAVQALYTGDKIILKKTIGASLTAVYSVAHTCAGVVGTLWEALNSAWSPWAYECMHNEEYSKLRQFSYYFIGIFMIGSLGTLLIGPELLMILGSSTYTQAKYTLPPVMVAHVCQFMYGLYVNAQYYKKKPFRIALCTITSTIFNLTLNYFLAPKYGYMATAYICLASYLLLFGLHYLSFISINGGKDWYNSKFNWGVVFGYICLIPVINFLYEHNMIRYGLIVVIMVIVMVLFIKYKKRIFEIIKEFIKNNN